MKKTGHARNPGIYSLLTITMAALVLAFVAACSPQGTGSEGSAAPADQQSPVIPSPNQNQGGDISGGGSGHEREFKDIAENLNKRFEAVLLYTLKYESGRDLTTEELKNVVSSMVVQAVPNELKKNINGIDKNIDALNYPGQTLVELSIPGWARLPNRQAKEDIVFHEVISLLKLEKNTYERSKAHLDQLRRRENAPDPNEVCPTKGPGSDKLVACLWSLYSQNRQEIYQIEEVLKNFAAPSDKDDLAMADEKRNVRSWIYLTSKEHNGRIEGQCLMSHPSAAESFKVSAEGMIMSVSEQTNCQIRVMQDRLRVLRQYYSQTRSAHPEIPLLQAPDAVFGIKNEIN